MQGTQYNSKYLFGKDWFQKYQKGLLFLCNAPVIKYWFRWVLRIHKDLSFKEKVYEIQPGNYKVYLGLKWTKEEGIRHHFRADFRTHNKFSKRLFNAFYPLWVAFHIWDLFADHYTPKLSLGFATLTVYPDANVESTTVDGEANRNGVDETWGTIRAGAGVGFNDSGGADRNFAVLLTSNTTNQYAQIYRSFFLFDISSLAAGQTISAAVLSFYLTTLVDQLTGGGSANSALVIVETTPASNTAIAASDYGNIGTTDFGRSSAQGSLGTGAYHDITLNAAALTYVTSIYNGADIVKLGARYGWDFDNLNPHSNGLTWALNSYMYIEGSFADVAGTTQDPKLVITYSVASTFTPKVIMF